MSHVWYNGVRLAYVRTESADAEVVRDGPNYLFTRHQITFDTLIAGGLGSQFLLPGGSRAEVIRRVRHALEQPRKDFKFEFGGATVLDATKYTDVNHGPMPEVIGFTDFVGGESVHVKFRITVCKRECDNRGEQTPEYLSHRWSESADFGEDFRTTYRRSGSLIIASNARLNGRPVQSVDEFRFLVVPPIPFGFQFESAHFDTSPDGLTLSYEVEYRERDADTNPPSPAVRADGKCVVHTQNGAKCFALSTCRLTGHPHTNKPVLVATAIAVAMTRLERAGAIKNKSDGRWKVWGSISEEMYKNVVEVQLNAIIDMQDRFAAALLPDPVLPAGGGRGPDVGRGRGPGGGDNPTVGDGSFGLKPTGEDGTSKPGPDAFDAPSVGKYKPPPPLGYPAGVEKPGDPPPGPGKGLLLPKGLVPFGFGLPAGDHAAN